MADLLKNVYNEKFFDRFLACTREVVPGFDATSFLEAVYDDEWEERALKQRMRHITMVLKNTLPGSYSNNIKTFLRLLPVFQKSNFDQAGLAFIFLPDFIEVYGLESYKTSVRAMEKVTQFVTCEFAVRPFILNYEKEMMGQMYQWSGHKHPMVRRLASEGCRPRLPWAMGIPFLKKDPSEILPILENLKNDTSESVRRSVANNLNDISKDHPQLVIEQVKKWQGASTETDALIKHASRTLLKQGNPVVMELFGFGKADAVKIKAFNLLTPKVKIGEHLAFAFELVNTSKAAVKIRLEYGVYYQKANGTLSRKVFKISEKNYAGNTTTSIHRKQSFKIITTRKFHRGKHQVALILNGVELEKYDFELV